MWLPEEAERSAAALWQKSFAEDRKVIALNIGASWKTKRWLDGFFAETADHFIERGYGIAFFGGPMDEELVTACRAKMRHGASAELQVFTGRVRLAELAALLKRCALFITTDSGPMHVGVAMNVPIVTMFGSSPVPGFYPYDAKDVLIKTPEDCHPCGKHACFALTISGLFPILSGLLLAVADILVNIVPGKSIYIASITTNIVPTMIIWSGRDRKTRLNSQIGRAHV